ncbi:uncharacterized protein SPPG_08401 [Spizellomyces punctatus DAOM BR117]|uniref:Uncharacterized protein n=1 Tax=Spizellomyces punctatus (strain DAOM BR117) TaxID=645134 RepID=A0A0L0H5K6_SPIPD|nr:uncharacterized protein SPPG_08401 [Spizellomyces punctatus DAOM BR117]KNC96249.1 hypothetical protein SPPG_08401 [Spizellomyces punctatus DAOM BR117]|eukprot:XP_016604289.1 hypothetical protein SPPG_08401 [Spizellomyces punctatus DAOM BR117]
MAAAAYATKFGLLLQSFDPVLSNIENGIAHSTEAAVDLEDSITAFRATGNGGTDIDGEEQQITQLDASIKSYLDMVQELNSQKRILEDMRARLTAGQQLGDGDLVAWFEEKYADEQREWEATDEAARYHGNEEYVEFRRKLWEKRYPNKPFSLTPGENEQEEDDELEIVSQNQSLVCPITQSLLEDPVTSNVCNTLLWKA